MKTADGNIFGPATKSQLETWHREGRIDSSSRIRVEGWISADELFRAESMNRDGQSAVSGVVFEPATRIRKVGYRRSRRSAKLIAVVLFVAVCGLALIVAREVGPQFGFRQVDADAGVQATSARSGNEDRRQVRPKEFVDRDTDKDRQPSRHVLVEKGVLIEKIGEVLPHYRNFGPGSRSALIEAIGKPSRTQRIGNSVYWYYPCADGEVQIVERYLHDRFTDMIFIEAVNHY